MATRKAKWDGEVAEIQQFVEKQGKLAWRQALERRIAEEFDQMYCLNQTPVPNVEGKYETVVDNAPLVFADKLISELATADHRYTIPLLSGETKTKEDAITMTELTVYGLHNLADENAMSVPFGCPIQSQMGFLAVTSGIYIARFLMYEEEKKVIPDMAIWEFPETYWANGKRRIAKLVHVRYASPEEVSAQYGRDFVPKNTAGIEIHDYWDETHEVVVIEGEVVDEQFHGLGYVPAKVITVASAPVQSDAGKLVHTVQSCWAKSKDTWKARSRLLSYRMSLVKYQVNRPLKNIYDSTKGGEPVEFSHDPNKPGVTTPMDQGKGQDVTPMEVVEMTRDADKLEADLGANAARGSAPDVLYGVLNQDITAQGTAMLIHAAMSPLKQGQMAVEAGLTWFANEAISQCKLRKYKDIQIQGLDGKANQFATTIQSEKLVDDRKIEAFLNIFTPQDDMESIGKAAQLKQSGLASDRYIREKVLKQQDTDGDMEQMATERIKAMTGIDLRHEQKKAIEEGDELAALELQKLITELQARLLNQMGGAPVSPLGGGGETPIAAMPGAAMAEASPENRVEQQLRTAARR